MQRRKKHLVNAVELPPADSVLDLEIKALPQWSEIHTLRVGPTSILLSDEFNHIVVSLNIDGTLNWKTSGAEAYHDSGFRYPRGLLQLGDRIWVCDSQNHRLVALDNHGNQIEVLDSSIIDIVEPSDLGSFEDGTFFVVEKRRHRILVLGATGALLATLGKREQKLTIRQRKHVDQFINPFIDPDAGIIQKFFWQYPHQVSWDGNRLWSTDNTRLLVNGRDSEIILKVETKKFVTYRGLTAFTDGCVFLEERSGAICLVDLSGRIAVLRAGDSKIIGCGRAPDESIALLIGNSIHLHSFPQLKEYAVDKGAFSPSIAKPITRFFSPEKQQGQQEADFLFDSIMQENDTDAILNFLVRAGMAAGSNITADKVGSYLLGCLDGRLEQLTSDFSKLTKWRGEPVIASSGVVTPIVVVPNAKELLQANRYLKDFQVLITGIHENLRLLERIRVNLGIWEEVLSGGQAPHKNGLISKAFAHNSKGIIALCRASAEERRAALARAIDILAEAEKEPAANSVKLAGENVIFTIADQIMETCIRLVHLLIFDSETIEYDSTEIGKLKTVSKQGVNILKHYFLYPKASVRYLSSKKPTKTLKPETQKLVRKYAALIVKIANDRREFSGEAKKDLKDVLAYSTLVWKLIYAVDRIGLVTGASLNFFWDKDAESAGKILNSIGFERLVKDLKEIEPDKPSVKRTPREIAGNLLSHLKWLNEDTIDVAGLVSRISDESIVALESLRRAIQSVLFHVPVSSIAPLLKAVGNIIAKSAAEDSDTMDFLTFCATSCLALGQENAGLKILETAASFNTNRELAAKRAAHSIDPCLAPDIKTPLLERSRRVWFSPNLAWDHDSLNRFWDSASEYDSYEKWFSQFTIHPSFAAQQLLASRWEQQGTISRFSRIRKRTYAYTDVLADSLYTDMAAKGALLPALDYMKSDHRWRDDGAEIRLQGAKVLQNLDRFDEALSLIHSWEHVNGPSVASLTMARQIFLQRGEFGKAFAVSRDKVITGGSEEKQLLNEVYVYIELNDYVKARECIDSVPDNSPLKNHKELLQGRLALKQFNPAKALSIFQSLLSNDPENDSLRFLVLATKIHQGHVDEVLNLCRLAASTGLRNPPLDILVINALQHKENWAAANNLCRKLLIIKPGDYIAAFLFSAGLLNSTPSRTDELFIEGFIDRYPWISHAEMMNASLQAQKAPAKALKIMKGKAGVSTSREALHTVIRAAIALRCGKHDIAIAALTPIAGKFGLEEIPFVLAEALIEAGQTKEAGSVLEPLRSGYSANPLMQRLEKKMNSGER